MSPEDYALPAGWDEQVSLGRTWASYVDEYGEERVTATVGDVHMVRVPREWDAVPVSVWMRAALRAYTLRRDV